MNRELFSRNKKPQHFKGIFIYKHLHNCAKERYSIRFQIAIYNLYLEKNYISFWNVTLCLRKSCLLDVDESPMFWRNLYYQNYIEIQTCFLWVLISPLVLCCWNFFKLDGSTCKLLPTIQLHGVLSDQGQNYNISWITVNFLSKDCSCNSQVGVRSGTGRLRFGSEIGKLCNFVLRIAHIAHGYMWL